MGKSQFGNPTAKEKGNITIETAYRFFPVLEKMKDRPAGMTSGGEQQMLAIARSLMTNPKLFLLDEPLEGLSPLVIQELSKSIKQLKDEEGLTILLCEQNVAFATELCSRVYIIEKGVIRFQGSTEDFKVKHQVSAKSFSLFEGVAKEWTADPQNNCAIGGKTK